MVAASNRTAKELRQPKMQFSLLADKARNLKDWTPQEIHKVTSGAAWKQAASFSSLLPSKKKARDRNTKAAQRFIDVCAGRLFVKTIT